MATTTYQCNVCKRQIEKQDNLQGLTIFGKCIITNGCLGELNRVSRNIDGSRDSFPAPVAGLLDYAPRKAFSSFNQNILSVSWTVPHNLSTNPAVSVYATSVDGGTLAQLDPEDFAIGIIDKDTISLTFSQAYLGVAQCLARSTTRTYNTTALPADLVQVTAKGILTMAVPLTIVNVDPTPNTIMVGLGFDLQISVQEPSQPIQTSIEHISPAVDPTSPWADWPSILIRKRKNFLVRTAKVADFLVFETNNITNKIPDGTRIFFKLITLPNELPRIISSRELLFLLANKPFAAIDKVRDKVVDVGEMIDAPIDYFIYQRGELFADASLVDISYPLTLQVPNAN